MEGTKERKPILALALSFMLLGLGQLYNGQIERAARFFLYWLLISTVLSYFFSAAFPVYGVLFSMAVGVAFFLFVMVEAFSGARKAKIIQLKP